MPNKRPDIKIITVFAVILGFFAQPAAAQDSGVDILPTKSTSDGAMEIDMNDATHPALKLTPDKSEIVRLDKAASSIIVGNPENLSVLADNAQTLVFVPKTPGATHVTVLDFNGQVIMQRHVFVGSPKEKYVRIRKSCAAAGSSACESLEVYYCPDMCHETLIGTQQQASNAAAEQEPGQGGDPSEGEGEGAEGQEGSPE